MTANNTSIVELALIAQATQDWCKFASFSQAKPDAWLALI